jgi:hypothetical protein
MVPNVLFDTQTVGSIANLMLANLLNHGSLLGDLKPGGQEKGQVPPPGAEMVVAWPRPRATRNASRASARPLVACCWSQSTHDNWRVSLVSTKAEKLWV